MNAVVTELSCFSESCVPQTVQYHCETNTMILIWQKGNVLLGGFGVVSMLEDEKGYNVTIASNDGGGFSSNISFMADDNNGTTILCTDLDSSGSITNHCSLVIGEFYF